MVEKTISEFAQENNLIYGICGSEKITHTILSPAPFVNYTYQQRINPRLSMPNTKSIIVIGKGYNKKISFENDNRMRANFSISAVGTDYHITLKKLMVNLSDKLNAECKIFSDTGALNERSLAYKSGLGFIGKNQCVISEKLGSMFFIGYIMTDLNLKPTNLSIKNNCGSCKKCIDACPGNALTENGFDYKKCVSYLTQKNKKLSHSEIKKMGRQLYGCDVCQLVCPYNKFLCGEINCINEKMPLIEKILSSSNKKLYAEFKNRAVGWRSNLLKRNAVIALINNPKKNEFIKKNSHLKEIIEREIKKWDIGTAED